MHHLLVNYFDKAAQDINKLAFFVLCIYCKL